VRSEWRTIMVIIARLRSGGYIILYNIICYIMWEGGIICWVEVGRCTVEIGLSLVAVAKPGERLRVSTPQWTQYYSILIISSRNTGKAGCAAVLVRKICAVCAYFRQRYCCSRHRKHRRCASSQSYRALLCVILVG